MILNFLLNNNTNSLLEELSNKINRIMAESIDSLRISIMDEVINEQRFKITNRVRNGKVQRRKKVSSLQGYRFQDGKLVRMSSREKLNRKRAQRKGAIKRKSKVASSLRKRKISIRKRGAL